MLAGWLAGQLIIMIVTKFVAGIQNSWLLKLAAAARQLPLRHLRHKAAPLPLLAGFKLNLAKLN